MLVCTRFVNVQNFTNGHGHINALPHSYCFELLQSFLRSLSNATPAVVNWCNLYVCMRLLGSFAKNDWLLLVGCSFGLFFSVFSFYFLLSVWIWSFFYLFPFDKFFFCSVFRLGCLFVVLSALCAFADFCVFKPV